MKTTTLRQPRPLHATTNAIKYKETNNVADLHNLYNTLIANYVLNGFTYNGISLSVEQFSIKLQIPQALVLKGITQAANTFKDFISNTDAESTFRALSGMALNNSLADRGLVAQQLQILMASQGGKYKPFISGSVNQALDLMMKSNDRLLSVISAIFGKDSGTTINILNQQNSVDQDAILTTEKAVALLSTPDALALPDRITDQQLFDEHVKDKSPEIRAIKTELDGVSTGKIAEVHKGLIEEAEVIPD